MSDSTTYLSTATELYLPPWANRLVVPDWLKVSVNLFPHAMKKVRIPYVPGLPSLPIYVADDRGIFLDHGLDAELTNVGGDFGDAVRDVAAGDADLTFVAYFFVLETVIQSPGSLAVLQHNVDTKTPPSVYGLVAGPGINIPSVQDLAGKSVAVFDAKAEGARQHLFQAYAHSLAADVDAIPLGPDPFAAAPLLASGDLDAFLTLEPIATLVAGGVGGTLVGATPLSGVLPVIPTGAAVVTRKTLEKRPDFVCRITAALDEAVDYIRQYPEAMGEILVKYGSLPPEAVSLGEKFVLRFWKCTEIGTTEIGACQKYADYLEAQGVITAKVDVEPLYGGD